MTKFPRRTLGSATSTSGDRSVDRFSPLYCTYNGFLLGQFLSLSFGDLGRHEYADCRRRMLEFLHEIDVDATIPSVPLRIGSDEHATLFERVVEDVAARSRHLADIALLGALVANYGIQAREDAEFAQVIAGQIDGYRQKYRLPAIDLAEFEFEPEGGQMDDILTPALAYLTRAVAELDVEADTVFVIMPFKRPYASYFASFYRPSIEQAGRRALRAWGGLATEDYCDLLLQLIAKSGMVWADVSESNKNVFYELGAAHALGKLSLIVVREKRAAGVPANIGHDPIVRYTDTAKDWFQGAVAVMAQFITLLKELAERYEHSRVRSRVLEQAVNELRADAERELKPHRVQVKAPSALRPSRGRRHRDQSRGKRR